MLALRRLCLSGFQIARQSALSRATVSRLLRRHGLARLSALEPAPPVMRNQRQLPLLFLSGPPSLQAIEEAWTIRKMRASFGIRTAATTLAVVLLTGSNAGAGQRDRETASGLILDDEEQYVMVAGSHIPQKIKRKSIGTDTAYNVRIYTQREIQTTGRGSGVTRVLALDPSVSISVGRGGGR